MSARFEGRVVLVAGGTGGLGRAASSAFLDEGADVAVTYRNQPEWGSVPKLGLSKRGPAARSRSRRYR